MRTFRRRRRNLAAVLLVTCPAACNGWHTVPVSPVVYLSEQQPRLIRVTTTSGGQVVVRSPGLARDSLVGTTTRPGPDVEPSTSVAQAEAVWPFAIALADVTKVEVWRTSGSKTLLAIVIVPAVIVGIVALLCSGGACAPQFEAMKW